MVNREVGLTSTVAVKKCISFTKATLEKLELLAHYTNLSSFSLGGL